MSVPYAQDVLGVAGEEAEQALVITRQLGEVAIKIISSSDLGSIKQCRATDPEEKATLLLTLYDRQATVGPNQPPSRDEPDPNSIVGELRLLAGDWPSSR